MSERVLNLERGLDGLRREFEYSRQQSDTGEGPLQVRTARTHDPGSPPYPQEPKGRVGIVTGTATAGDATTITLLEDSTHFPSNYNGEYTNRTIRITEGTGKGQTQSITAYVGSSKIVTVAAFSPAVDATSKYSIEILYPIIFLDKDQGDRQVVHRKTAANLGSRYLPAGTQVHVVEIQGEWYIVEDDGESVIVVPKTTITAATRTVRGGSDKFTPGFGDAYVLFFDESADEYKALQHAGGGDVIKRVYNVDVGKTYEPGVTDMIEPETPILRAVLDRAGDLVVGGMAGGGGSTKIAKTTVLIPKKTGDTPGTATVNIWEFTNGGLAETSPLETETARNWTDRDIQHTTEFILLHQEEKSDRWMVHAAAVDIHDISADTGTTVTIDEGDTVDFDASDRDWDSESNSTQSLRGIVVKVETDGGDDTIKRLQHAIDKSPVQNIVLSGLRASGGPVLGRDLTRNSIEFEAGSTSIINLAGTSGKIAFTVANPLVIIADDAGPTLKNLNFRDFLEFTADKGDFTVTKADGVVTVNLASADIGLFIGAVVMGVKATKTDTGKEYADRDGDPDTDWALMDGASNLNPGSGVQLATESGTEAEFFVRALSGTGAATNTRFGRDSVALTADPDEDEVQVEVEVTDHPDHFHTINTDACDDDSVGGDPQEFQFMTQNPRTGGVVNSGGSPLTLSHAVTLTLTNKQSSADDKIEMTPDHKKLHFFERVA